MEMETNISALDGRTDNERNWIALCEHSMPTSDNKKNRKVCMCTVTQ